MAFGVLLGGVNWILLCTHVWWRRQSTYYYVLLWTVVWSIYPCFNSNATRQRRLFVDTYYGSGPGPLTQTLYSDSGILLCTENVSIKSISPRPRGDSIILIMIPRLGRSFSFPRRQRRPRPIFVWSCFLSEINIRVIGDDSRCAKIRDYYLPCVFISSLG